MELNDPSRSDALLLEEMLYEACFRLETLLVALGEGNIRSVGASPRLWAWMDTFFQE